jgi:hypothetical protein
MASIRPTRTAPPVPKTKKNARSGVSAVASKSIAREQNERLGQNARKWGPAIWDYGWTAVPNALLEGQRRLGISDSGLVVLLYLLKHWWTQESRAFPSQSTIANANGKSVRSIQRALQNISKVIETNHRRKTSTGNFQTNEYSFDALVSALNPIARDFGDQKAKAKAEREALKKPRLRTRHANRDEE